jgi:hypothetical protein
MPMEVQRAGGCIPPTAVLEESEWSPSRTGPFARGKDPVPTVQDAGWTSGPLSTGTQNLAPLGFDCWLPQPVGSRYTEIRHRGSRHSLISPNLLRI